MAEPTQSVQLSGPQRGWNALAQRHPVLLGMAWVAVALGILWQFRGLEQTGDSLSYLTSVRSGTGLFHPHHLVFNMSVHVVYLVVKAVSGLDDPLVAAQIHNLGFLAVGLGAVIWIGARFLGSYGVGWLGALLVASMTCMLVFSTQGEVYVPCASLLLVAAAAGLQSLDRGSNRATVVCTLAWTGAVCYHQAAVLFAVPIAALVLSRPTRDGVRRLMVIALGAGSMCASLYYLVYRIGVNPDWYGRSFGDFILFYSLHGDPTWGDQKHLGFGGFFALFRSHIWGASSRLEDAGGAVAVAVLCWIIASAGLVFWHGNREQRALGSLSVGWIVGFGAFFLWWFPEETEFATLTNQGACLLAMALLSFLLMNIECRRVVVSVVVLVVTIGGVNAASNLIDEALPRHRTRGQAYEMARSLILASPEPSLLLARHRVRQAIRYYFADRAVDAFEVTEVERLFQRSPERLPDRVATLVGHGIAMMASDLRPGANFSGRNGIREPKQWLAFLGWLLDVRIESDGSLTGRSMNPAKDDPTVIVFCGPRVTYASIIDLLDQLAAVVDSAEGSRSSFSHWMRLHQDVVRDVPIIVQVPESEEYGGRQ